MSWIRTVIIICIAFIFTLYSRLSIDQFVNEYNSRASKDINIIESSQSTSAPSNIHKDDEDVKETEIVKLPIGLYTRISVEETHTVEKQQEVPSYLPPVDDEGKDIIMMLENVNDLKLIYGESEFKQAIKQYEWRVIACNNRGIKSCVLTYERKHLERANAIIHFAAFTSHRGLTVSKRDDQAFIAYFTEADDSGCQQKQYDAKTSYAPDAQIRFNDNCAAIKKMYKCMSIAINILESLNIQAKKKRERNKHRRMLYQFCIKQPENDEKTIKAQYATWKADYEGDVAIFVSNCAKPRADFIEELINRNSDTIKVNSYGKCLNNAKTVKNKIEVSRNHKFLFAMENKMKENYVTEKSFQSYMAGVVPIYQGPTNVFEFLPRGSLLGLHSFATPKEMGDYVEYLLKNETAYDEFFDWDLDKWMENRLVKQCLRQEEGNGMCSTCDWLANVWPSYRLKGKKNCDKYDYAPYWGYPREPEKIRY